MVKQRKPRIGMLGIMHGIYDEKQPEITRNQEAYARAVCAHLSDVADVQFPRAAKCKEDIEAIVKEFNDQPFDGIMIVMLLYSPGMRLVQALKDNRLPLMLANIQPVPAVTSRWNWSDLTTNQGIHGAQDTANVLRRMGRPFAVVTEDWKSAAFKAFVEDWARAARTSEALKRARIATFGKMHQMGDILGDEFAFVKNIGPQVNHHNLGEVFRIMESLTEAEVDAQVGEDRKNFKVDPAISKESHRYAARFQLGFQRFLETQNYDGFSAHCFTPGEDGRFEQLPLLGASNLMAMGYGYAGEGDTNTATLCTAGQVLIGDAHFTEMYSLDFAKDTALMSHMGEGNWKIARRDRPIKLIDRPLEIGGLSNPPTLVFSAQPGPATLVSLAAIEGAHYRLVVLRGEILDTEDLADVPMPYFHLKPSTGIRKSMDSWLQAGGTHHQILNLGDHARRWRFLCDILGVECVEV